MSPLRSRQSENAGDYVHNTDLDPDPRYLDTLGAVGYALRFPRTLDLFRSYDAEANTSQQRFRRWGAASILLGAVALFGLTLELLLPRFGYQVNARGVVATEGTALVSVLLALNPWSRRWRTRWLTARFMTERTRQWFFQMLLDGAFVTLASREALKFEAERNRRWTQFVAQEPTASGDMPLFIDGENDRHCHPLTPYTDDGVAANAFQAYRELRLDKQLSYFRLKREEFAFRDDGPRQWRAGRSSRRSCWRSVTPYWPSLWTTREQVWPKYQGPSVLRPPLAWSL